MMRPEELPGDLLMWVLIASELAVFAVGVSAMMVVQLTDPPGFAAARAALDGRMAATNTLALVTSGLFAARAERAAACGRPSAARRNLGLAALGGLLFLTLKAMEYRNEFAAGIGIEAHPFFTFYFLLTGFHAAHVLAGIALMAVVAWRARAEPVQAAAMFWHMVDLVWVLILTPVYLLG